MGVYSIQWEGPIAWEGVDIRQTKEITYVGATQLGRLARDDVAQQSGGED